jgi:hypothetical protein
LFARLVTENYTDHIMNQRAKTESDGETAAIVVEDSDGLPFALLVFYLHG